MAVTVKWGEQTEMTTVEWLWKPFIPYGKVTIWMYATPVVYPLSTATDDLLRTALLLNPVTPMMELFRYMFLGQGQISVTGLVWSVVFTVIVLTNGVLLFNRVEKTFMDTV